MSNGVPVSQVRVDPVVALSTPKPVGFVRAAWERWKKVARAVGVVQTRILMVLFYFSFAFPLGLIMRMTSDPLRLKEPPGSNWSPHRDEDASLDAARRQF